MTEQLIMRGALLARIDYLLITNLDTARRIETLLGQIVSTWGSRLDALEHRVTVLERRP
jgi:hypothetical protein